MIISSPLEESEFSLPANILVGASSSAVSQQAEVKGDWDNFYKCVYSSLSYPPDAYSENLEYTAHIKLLIDEKGNLEWFEQADQDAYGFNYAAFQSFKFCSKNLKFKAGSINGQKVKCVEYLPIWFKIRK